MAISGRQSSNRAAFDTSARVLGTSAGWAGRYSITGFFPSSRAISSMIALSRTSRSPPRLITS